MKLLVSLLASLVLLLTACGGGGEQIAVRSSGDGGSGTTGTAHQPYPLAEVPLTDTEGDRVTLAEAEAPLTLVFFGYTHCPTECPIVMNTITSSLTRLSDEDRERVRVTFVTTDPSRDDQTVLREYLDRYDPGFQGLTGDIESIVKLATSMKIFVADGEQLESGGYDLGSHGTYISAVQDGGATMLWNMETTPGELADDIHTLLQES